MNCIFSLFLGYPANQVTKNQWLAPAVRIFVKLRHPQLYDKTLRQTLLAVARALNPPPTSTAVPMKTLAGPANYNSNNGGNGHTYSSQYKQQQHSQHGYTGPNAAEDPSLNQPQLTSTQEKYLFMKWLNEKYDAVEQIQDMSTIDTPTATTVPTTIADITTSMNVSSAENTDVANLAPKFHVPLQVRQQISIAISTHLRSVLTCMPPQQIVECVRDCEYALLLKAKSAEEYNNMDTLVRRIAAEVGLHPEWNIQAVSVKNKKNGTIVAEQLVVDLTDDAVPTANVTTTNTPQSATAISAITNPSPHPTAWRSQITEEIRQYMIDRVEKMLRLVSVQLRIHSLDDLNHKIQQYEMGLVMSATSMSEYTDKNTLPRRLAGLVTDFDEYKKTLSPYEWIE